MHGLALGDEGEAKVGLFYDPLRHKGSNGVVVVESALEFLAKVGVCRFQ